MSKKVYKQGDIIFVPFPYDDDRKRDENKKRGLHVKNQPLLQWRINKQINNYGREKLHCS